MLKATIHVLLVSAQAAPNLLPALDPELKPKEAVLLVSRKMTARAEALRAVLQEAGIGTSAVGLDDEHDFARLEAVLLDVAAKREGEHIALNVTGGTKLMALAAQSVASAAGWEIFYVDVDTDEVISLGSQPQRKPLAASLRLPHYLRAYGYTPVNGLHRRPVDHRREKLLRTLVLQVGSLERSLGRLNWLAQEAEDKGRLEARLSPQHQDSRSLEALLRHFEEAGVLRVEGPVLRFNSEANRAFAKGGWLEQYVYGKVSTMAGELAIRDMAANLYVKDVNGLENELDVVFLARNRVFVIECKTARMNDSKAPKANDTLYKLSEIKNRIGGLGARGMLASYRPFRDSEKRLADALGVELVCGPELARFDEILRRWVRGPAS